MNADQPNVITVPGKGVSIKVAATAAPQAHQTAYTSMAEFGEVQELLSNRPLRAPVRSRPIDD